jgi:hypothetical protein
MTKSIVISSLFFTGHQTGNIKVDYTLFGFEKAIEN